MVTPHCMHIGAPSSVGRTMPRGAVVSSGVSTMSPSCICADSSPADGTDFGSGGSSEPWRVR